MKTRVGKRAGRYYISFGVKRATDYHIDSVPTDAMLVEMQRRRLEKYFDAYDEQLRSSVPPVVIPESVDGWQLCPKCNGDGTVLVQNYNGNPTAICYGPVDCNLCNGKKIISRSTGLPPK